jgi:hypothetical protein
VLVVLLLLTFEQEPVVRSAREQGDVLRYVYIDRIWDKPDRRAFFVERMKYAGLADVWPDAIRCILGLASGRVAIALRRRCDRLADCLEPRLP